MSEVDHESREHALLSASGANRWLNCTPSARLEMKVQEKESVYAKEGTLAHQFGNIALDHFSGYLDDKAYQSELKKNRTELKKFRSLLKASSDPVKGIDEMEGEVEKYTDYIIERLSALRSADPTSTLLVEQKFDLSAYIEKGFGTGDAVLIGDNKIIICDLKYGKGVPVYAKENPQLKLYALGAIEEYSLIYDFEDIELVIFQPRLNHVDAWDTSVKDLLHWGESEVKQKASLAYEGKGLQKAGDWCRFCKVKGMCATLASVNVKMAQYEFADPHLLTEKQLVDIYRQIPMLVDWANSVHDHMTEEAKAGKHWPGYKLVEGRSIRKWSDEKVVEELLHALNFNEKDYLKRQLEGIAKIEKLAGKEVFVKNLAPYVIKPEGAPTLVAEADPRPAINKIEQAKIDFKD